MNQLGLWTSTGIQHGKSLHWKLEVDELMLARVQRMVYPYSSMVCDAVPYRLFCVYRAGNLRDSSSVQPGHHHRWVHLVTILCHLTDRQIHFIKIQARTAQHGLQGTTPSEEDYTRNLRLLGQFLLRMTFLRHLLIECSMDGAVDPKGWLKVDVTCSQSLMLGAPTLSALTALTH
jgi:hypothetical protein